MINAMDFAAMPKWLKKNKFVFDVKDVLTDSFFYPACRLDGACVRYYMGNAYSFLYVDYSIEKSKFESILRTQGFKGYRIIHRQSLSLEDIAPNGFKYHIYPEVNADNSFQYDMFGVKETYCEWVIFERVKYKDDDWNPWRFSFLFLCADGVAAAQSIYLANNIKPKIVAIIQSGHGFGGNWTNFTDRNAIFAKSVLYKKELWPKYLINGGRGNGCHEPIWPEYDRLNWLYNCQVSGYKSFSIWQLNPEAKCLSSPNDTN